MAAGLGTVSFSPIVSVHIRFAVCWTFALDLSKLDGDEAVFRNQASMISKHMEQI
jgi:hypothetical protein